MLRGADCTVVVPTRAKSNKTGSVSYNETFKLTCGEGFTADAGNVDVHKCTKQGVVSPSPSNFKCYARKLLSE